MVASNDQQDVVGGRPAAFSMTRRTFFSSSISGVRVCSRPAVSTISTSIAARLGRLHRVERHRPGIGAALL